MRARLRFSWSRSSLEDWRNAGLALAALSLAGSPSAAEVMPDQPAALRQVCGRCHNMEVVVNTPRSFEAWRDTVQQMVDRGAAGTDAQFDEIIDYLHANLSTINVNTADADDLGVVLNVPDSVAEAIVARRTVRKFTSLEELKAITGLDPRVLDAKARMIFF